MEIKTIFTFQAIITPFIAQVASGHSLYIPITIYGVTAVLGLVAAISLPIETKGRQMRVSSSRCMFCNLVLFRKHIEFKSSRQIRSFLKNQSV